MTEHAYSPIKRTEVLASFDLCSFYNYIILPNGRQLVKTDLILNVLDRCYGRIALRSELALNNFIDIGGDVIHEGDNYF